jgi:hypothetical protein
VQSVSREIGVSVATLELWRADAAARLQAVITTMDEALRSAWRREHGVYPTELQLWKENATAALSEVPEERVSPRQTRDARKRIDFRMKDYDQLGGRILIQTSAGAQLRTTVTMDFTSCALPSKAP